jgi:hypothetical protein
MLTDVVQLWEELSTEADTTGKYLERLIRPDSDIEIVLGSGSGRIALTIAADFPSDWNRQLQVPNCMSCELTQGREISKAKLQLKAGELKDIFVWFSQDVANRMEGGTAQTVPGLLSQALVEWAEAFRVDPEKGMSRQAQQGLFAELFFLEEVLLPEYSADALLAWHSQNSVHDFQIEQTAWEVKSFGGRRMEVRISSEDQLDTIGLSKLILSVVGLKVSEEAGASVGEIVDRLISRCVSDTALSAHFKTGLAKYGYVDRSSIVHEYFFTPRLLAEYEVTNGFPRITSRNIPSAVSDVHYALSLASLEKYLDKPMVEF